MMANGGTISRTQNFRELTHTHHWNDADAGREQRLAD